MAALAVALLLGASAARADDADTSGDAATSSGEAAGESAPPEDDFDPDLDPRSRQRERAAEDDAAAETLEPVRKGVQLQGTLGLSDCTGGICSNGDASRMTNTRLGLGIGVSGWYRLLPLVSVGLGLHYNLLGVADRERVTNSAAYWDIEVGGRFHPLQRGPIDAFAGLSFGYLAYSISADFTERDYTQTESTNAVFFALSAGGEYYLAPRMSIGGLFQLSLPLWIKQCFETLGAEDCDAVGDMLQTQKDQLPATVWYLGGTFSYHLSL